MRCIAHIINLVVVDGLKETNVSVKRVREAVRYIRQSPARLQKFKSCCEMEGIESKSSLCLDVCTRWNSTYLMLNVAQKFENAFDRYATIDPCFKFDLQSSDGLPDSLDWENVRRLVDFLGHFYDLTLRISGSRYVTSNIFFNEISSVDCLLQEWQGSNDIELACMGDRMKKTYQAEHERGSNVAGNTGENNESEGAKKKSRLNLGDQFLKHKIETGEANSKSDLDCYLNEGIKVVDEKEEFDILKWWQLNSGRFPILSIMVRDILAMPISTVASESAFSTRGRVLDPFRSSLTPKIVEALICAQDWLRSPIAANPLKSKLLTLKGLKRVCVSINLLLFVSNLFAKLFFIYFSAFSLCEISSINDNTVNLDS
ncbi:hypothetical protein GH714_032126 [Hevea brasiliensis]|uniref:HAT C-terminal dimerisation domain-containing protein n=1 Tax=Hevea brasiliensis TaxID=3981 RepID=A0A6A6KJX5_HEVBR|nr:hypothetical protein GH714_032126 [Hevea brasiliensis]